MHRSTQTTKGGVMFAIATETDNTNSLECADRCFETAMISPSHEDELTIAIFEILFNHNDNGD